MRFPSHSYRKDFASFGFYHFFSNVRSKVVANRKLFWIKRVILNFVSTKILKIFCDLKHVTFVSLGVY